AKFCPRNNDTSGFGCHRAAKPSGAGLELDVPSLATALASRGFTWWGLKSHMGRGTPQTSRSPRPFRLAEPAQNSNRARHCEPLRGATSQLTYRCSSRLRLFNLREAPRSSAAERDPQSSRTPPAQELETNFDDFSACSDAEAVSGGVVRVSVLVAPQGVLRIVHMTNDRPREHSDACADD